MTGQVIKRIDGINDIEYVDERNLRTVWQFPPSSNHGNHTAAFPLELPLRCLRLTTTTGDLVFDPFAGSGTTLAAASLLGCSYFGCDIVESAIRDAKRRVKDPAAPLLIENDNSTTPVKNNQDTNGEHPNSVQGTFEELDAGFQNIE